MEIMFKIKIPSSPPLPFPAPKVLTQHVCPGNSDALLPWERLTLRTWAMAEVGPLPT